MSSVTDNTVLEKIQGIWGSIDPHDSTVELVRSGLVGPDKMLIDGALVDAASGARFDNVNPTDEQVLGTVPDAGVEDVERAIAAARRAFDETDWSTNASFRKHCLLQFHEALQKNADLLRAFAVLETGIAIRTTYGFHSEWPISSVPYWADVAANYEYEKELPDRPWSVGNRHIVRHEAVGVVAAITPWNFPLQTAFTKILPALAAGCTVILKPAKQTPWHATLLAKLIAEETDFPAGVVNIVTPYDDSVAEILATDPRVDMIHFTGSTNVGKKLMRHASERIANIALELGGKSANILLEDVDLAGVLPIAAGMVGMNAGQGCVLPTRLLVPRSRYDEAVELSKLVYETIPFGDPARPDVIQGPQISELQKTRILDLIGKGVEEGANLVVGGGTPAELTSGYFVQPTLFTDVDPDSIIAQREIFGPVLAMIPYDDVDDALRIANNSLYGLAGYVWGNDVDQAVQVARGIRAGMLGVNGGFTYAHDAPSGGYKQSGLGRESGVEGFEEFLESKLIAVAV